VTNSGPASLLAGTNATYTITLTNNGPSDAQNVVLTDTLPTGSVFVSLTPAAGNPDSFSLSLSATTATATTATVAAGHTDTFTLVTPAPTTLAIGPAYNDAHTLSSSTTHPTTAHNTATVTGSVVQGADLVVANAAPTTSVEGNTITFTFKV